MFRVTCATVFVGKGCKRAAVEINLATFGGVKDF